MRYIIKVYSDYSHGNEHFEQSGCSVKELLDGIRKSRTGRVKYDEDNGIEFLAQLCDNIGTTTEHTGYYIIEE